MRRHQTGAVLARDPCDVSCVRCHVSRVRVTNIRQPLQHSVNQPQHRHRHRGVICIRVTFTLELQTRVAEDYAKFYNHGEGLY